MTVQIPVRIPEEDAERLDAVVASGRYASRSDALRSGLELILRQERDREILESYRRAYAECPEEESEIGLWALTELVRKERAAGYDAP
ncbi:MAG: ribbon-helix-helix domain-containing protein [Thermoleophilia bacterium]|nr:ribbon-helix-helix domain-containing protein [Thermoleophilia bacterium]